MSDVLEKLTPFGNPDGSRASLDQITKTFVSFKNATAWGGLSTPPNDLSARILVGRKGSGKTLYLRRLQAHASTEESLYADAIQQDHISTTNVLRFCQWFPQREVTEKWMQLWRRAILRSLLSHLLCNPKIRRPSSQMLKDRIAADFPQVVRVAKAAVSVYSEATAIMHEYRTRNQLEEYFDDTQWSELESVIADFLTEFPPLCFYIDAVDESFEAAPIYWLQCQKGLFFECMQFLRDSKFGGRLHVVIAIRDIVLSSVYQGEHQTKFINEPHIRVLNWNNASISYFLHEKIKLLKKSFLAFPNSDKGPVHSWLGISEIENIKRGISEPIEQYLLRHTRLLPRDIVILGNILCSRLSSAKKQEQTESIPSIIRGAVKEAASIFGSEQLTICANEFVSSLMPKHAAHQGYEDAYTANGEYSQGVVEQLKMLISLIGKDRFSRSDIESAEKLDESLFVDNSDPWSILWRNGMIGYVDEGAVKEKHIFHSDDKINRFSLPRTVQTYLFHPVLIDAVGLKSDGEIPVVPIDNGRSF